MAKKNNPVVKDLDEATIVATPKSVATPTETKNTDLYSKLWRDSYDKEAAKTKPVLFELVKHKMVKGVKNYQAEVFFPSEDIIFDKEAGKRRKIRYSRGEQSIYVDKQSKDAKAKMIKFEQGLIVVHHTDPLLLDFMRKCNYNKTNPERLSDKKEVYFEVNSGIKAKKSVEEEVTILEASTLALRAPLNKIIPVAKYLNVSTNKSIDEIRYALKNLAAKNPKKFIELFDNKEAMFKGTCIMAREYGIIKVTDNDIKWENGTKIMSIPLGQPPFEALVTYLKEENKFAEYVNQLESRMDAIIGK